VGAGTSGVFFPDGCTPSEAIPIISFGTTEDPYHPADWTRDGAHQWAEFQGCDPPEIRASQSNLFIVEETRYRNCRDDAEILLVLVEGAIPGIWFNSESPWAGDLDAPYDDPPAYFLDFFESHTG
jgi:poly(3-hydroxybutyrate) depolymerase